MISDLFKRFFKIFKSVFEVDTLVYIILCIGLPWSVIKIANIYPGDKVTLTFMLVIIAMYFLCVILICPILETNRELKNILKETEKTKDFKDLSKIIKQNKYYKIKNSFIEFEKNTKEKQDKNNNIKVYTSIDSSYYIDEDNLIYNDLKSKLIDQIGQSFTGVGIFGTFLGIVRGVSSLNVSDANAMRDGIATLLAGVKVSFNSSLYGLLASLTIMLIYKVLLDMTITKINRLNNKISSIVIPDLEDDCTSSEEDISLLKQQISELNVKNNKLIKYIQAKQV